MVEKEAEAFRCTWAYFGVCFTNYSSLKPPLVVTFSFAQWRWRKENILWREVLVW